MGKRLNKTPNECAKLRAWLRIPGNTTSVLAARLGCSSSTTIDQWLIRGRISLMRIKEVMAIIRPDKVYKGPVGVERISYKGKAKKDAK